ncbi:hypothetical protein J2S74_000891 [Evansella vedderi]|uniref:Uncharacterized protein n=1 Tax=Evansella vedderi TaxID=38282 RepID=A0ABT9ZQP8_9BACI|nr:hypothetical protein [Evansella vedderi]MDQ0253519.1 hypothetical protein [Evansella vedderi]
MSKKKNTATWAEAKKRCRLNQADIQMAKELGMTPKSLIKNIPTRNEQWKAPVKVWISDLYEKKFGTVLTVNSTHSKKTSGKKKPMISESWDDEELPF